MMTKIILLDWDGPISNSRTWKMPGCADPVAIQLLNDLTLDGWKTLLTSTIRKNFKSDYPKAEATEFMKRAGFYVQWYDPIWRTDINYTARRHLEVANMLMNHDFPEDTLFLVVDDEKFPHEFLSRGRMHQVYASPNSGIDYLCISRVYHLLRMSDTEFMAEFSEPAERDEDEDEDDEE